MKGRSLRHRSNIKNLNVCNSEYETRHFKIPKTFYVSKYISIDVIVYFIKETGLLRRNEVDNL